MTFEPPPVKRDSRKALYHSGARHHGLREAEASRQFGQLGFVADQGFPTIEGDCRTDKRFVGIATRICGHGGALSRGGMTARIEPPHRLGRITGYNCLEFAAVYIRDARGTVERMA